MTSDPRDGTFRPDAAVSPQRLDRAVKTFRPALSWGDARDLIHRGKVTYAAVAHDLDLPFAKPTWLTA